MAALPRTESITLSVEDSFLHVTLNRPDARNAITTEMIAEVKDIFVQLEDLGVRGVVLRGAGGNFCAGGDIKDMNARKAQSRGDDREFIAGYSADAGSLYHTVKRSRLPVIAVLEGAVLGGGLGLACCADIVISMDKLHFGLPETRLGLVPAQVAPFIVRRMGKPSFAFMSLTGRQFDATQAEKMGLANHVVKSEEELQITLTEVKADIRACAPQAVMSAKLLMADPRYDESETPGFLGLIFARAMLGEESKEGMTAFLEKRQPRWDTDL